MSLVSKICDRKIFRLTFILATFALLLFSSFINKYANGKILKYWQRKPILIINHELGFAYTVRLEQVWMSSHDKQSPAFVLENGIPLGPSNAQHDAIRKLGNGRFSFWHDCLYFSSSDNSDPRYNGRKYEVYWPRPLRPEIIWIIYGITCFFVILNFFLLGQAFPNHSNKILSFFVNSVLVVGAILFTLLVIEIGVRFFDSSAGIERIKITRWQNLWPSSFDPKVGFRFKPRETVRLNNFVDFNITQQTNSLGFLDREHSFLKPKDTFRILILGDSFVEAAQVELKDKFHVLLESMLSSRYSSKKFEVIALGFSGCGTSSELSFYEEIGKNFNPDIVIALFIYNDFANNSPLLESTRNGWHPYCSPRLFFEKKGSLGYERLNIDPNWDKHVFKIENKICLFEKIKNFLDRFLKWSFIYNWSMKKIEISFRILEKNYHNKLAKNLVELKKLDKFKENFIDWNFPKDYDIDYMFFAKNMPKVFNDAIDITNHVMKIFKEETLKNNSKIIIVAADVCSDPMISPNASYGDILDKGIMKRIKHIADANHIPFLDLYETFSKKGDPENAHWGYDTHWNKTGHRWAAESIYEYLEINEKQFLIQ